MGDLLTVQDLEAAKKHDTFHSEVISGKAGGVAGGASIDYATNEVTGQVQKTLPRTLLDIAFVRTGTFAAGATLTDMRQTLEYSGHEYSWAGTFPKVVAAGATPATSGGIGAGAWVDRTDLTLRGELSDESGARLVHHGAGDISSIFDAARPLSYYGTDSIALTALLNYAKSSGNKVRLDSDVTVTSTITIDFAGAVIELYFDGFSVLSDTTALQLQNLGRGSVIDKPSMKNITTPWVITRWDYLGNWLEDGAPVLATLTQTNDEGYYMPSGNDTDIYGSLTSEQQNQTISARFEIDTSDGIFINEPQGRYALYEFYGCNNVTVNNPHDLIGGKGYFGTIVFNNTNSTSWGYGNKVVGGIVKYGSFCSVVFLRNRGYTGGVFGDFVTYRAGESGVKTYQGEVAGVSARCYELTFSNVHSFQAVYDSIDYTSDYGTETERVADYTLAEYAWHQLPTRHRFFNVNCIGGKGGFWGDGQYNSFTSISATDCLHSGIKSKGTKQDWTNVVIKNCNVANTTVGEHQIALEGVDILRGITIIVTSNSGIVEGEGLWAPNSYVSGYNSTLIETSITKESVKGIIPEYGNLLLGIQSASDNTSTIAFNPRIGSLANPVGEVVAVVTGGTAGDEYGNMHINPVIAGSSVHGLRAVGANGGTGVCAIATSENPGIINNSEVMFYQSGTSIIVAAKLADGTYKTATLIP